MANPVNDPALIAKLNGGAVSDPALLARLNGGNDHEAKVAAQIEADRKAMDPAAGMSFGERALVGAGASIDRAWEGIKGLMPGYEESARSKDDRAAYERNKENLGAAGTIGELGADILMTAAPVAKGAAFTGKVLQKAGPKLGSALTKWNLLPTAIAGGATSAALDPTDRTGAAIGGAVGGALGEAGGRALTKTMGGLFRGNNMSQDAADLIKAGVDVPLWKTTDSGLLRNLVERAKVYPVAGKIFRDAEGRAMRDVELKLMNDANPMRPIMEPGHPLRWEKGAQIKNGGEEGMGTLHQNFNDAYDALYKGRAIPVDQQYGSAMANILRDAKGYHPGYADDLAGASREIDDLLRSGTESTFSRSPILNEAGQPFVNEQMGHAAVSTNNVKSALDSVRARIESAVRRGEIEKANVLKQMEGELLDLRTRGLPQEVAGMGKDIDRAYATYKQLQRANTSIGSKGQGYSSPSQILNSIKAADRTPGKSAFAEGKALNQDFVQKAKNVLGDRLPDVGPGTAEKLAMLGLAGLPMLTEDYGIMTPAALLLSSKAGRRALSGGMKGQESIRNYGSKYLTPALRSIGVAGSMED